MPGRKPLAAAMALMVLTAVLAGAPAAAQTGCFANSSWVNNPTLPESLNESNHCNFAIFSWQSFLALMQPLGGGSGKLVFEDYMSWDGLFVPDGRQPAQWGQSPWPLTLGDLTKQAGSGNDLIAQSGAEVQFDISVNRPMYEYIKYFQLYNANCFNAAAGTTPIGNVHMPPTSAQFTGLGSIELKTAWLPMNSCDPNKYHCTKALVNNQPMTVGLVGIHIVHKLPDHQEWIWSSFEHINNAPDCARVIQPPAGYNSWNFFRTGFVPVNQPCPACPNNGGSCDPTRQCNTFVNEHTAPNVCRTQPLLTVRCNPQGDPMDDQNDVACLNPSVWSLLPSSSVWRNYMLVGTIWFKPGMTSPTSTGQTQVGNLTLANTTMETYTQATNCFGCHTTNFKKFSASSPETTGHADFSHIFNRIQALGGPMQCPPLPPPSQASH